MIHWWYSTENSSFVDTRANLICMIVLFDPQHSLPYYINSNTPYNSLTSFGKRIAQVGKHLAIKLYSDRFNGNGILGWHQSETVVRIKKRVFVALPIILSTPCIIGALKSIEPWDIRNTYMCLSRIFHLTMRLFRLQRYLPINKYYGLNEKSFLGRSFLREDEWKKK